MGLKRFSRNGTQTRESGINQAHSLPPSTSSRISELTMGYFRSDTTPRRQLQARNQDFMWGGGGRGGSNEAKVDQTSEMYFLLSDPFI